MAEAATRRRRTRGWLVHGGLHVHSFGPHRAHDSTARSPPKAAPPRWTSVIGRGLSPVAIEEQRNGNAAQNGDARQRHRRRACRSRPSKASRASWPTCSPAGLPLSAALHLLRREASNPRAKHVWSQDPRRRRRRHLAGRRAGEVAQGVLHRLRRDGPRRRGRRVSAHRAPADRRLPHPRAGTQRQGQSRDGLPVRAGVPGGRRAGLPADVLHPALLGHLRRVRRQAAVAHAGRSSSSATG